MRKSAFLRNLRNWEYWPVSAFYVPLLPLYAWLSIRAGHPFFYVAANPGIPSGGSGFESKYDIIRQIPAKWRPRSILVRAGSQANEILRQLQNAGIVFPVIAKPDIGFRGLLVEKIARPDALLKHLGRHHIDFIVQEFIDLPREFSIFYYKMEGEATGHITSLTSKEWLTIRGDGKHRLSELIARHDRARRQTKQLKRYWADRWDTVLPDGEHLTLTEIGNHSRGARFINANALINEELLPPLEELHAAMDGWYYGRVDLRARNLDAVKAGDFKIFEINGVLAEPTHIYDQTTMTYFGALREIARHWKILYRVATHNHRVLGVPYDRPGRYIQSVHRLFRYLKHAKRQA